MALAASGSHLHSLQVLEEGFGDYDGAQELYERALSQNRLAPYALLAYGNFLMTKRGDMKGAEELVRTREPTIRFLNRQSDFLRTREPTIKFPASARTDN